MIPQRWYGMFFAHKPTRRGMSGSIVSYTMLSWTSSLLQVHPWVSMSPEVNDYCGVRDQINHNQKAALLHRSQQFPKTTLTQIQSEYVMIKCPKVEGPRLI